MSLRKTSIILCRCRGDHFPDTKHNQLAEHLSATDIDLYLVDDLCGAVLTNAQSLNDIQGNNDSFYIFACHPRAINNLIRQNQVNIPESNTINFRDNQIDQTIRHISSLNLTPGKATVHEIKADLNVPSWYPLIDKERCTSCGRCVKFCLFGVYRQSDDDVTVQNPLNCKNNCPACARACPESAIIFPKYADGGVIAGEEGKLNSEAHASKGQFTSRLGERKELRKSIIKASLLQQVENKQMNLKQQKNNPES